MVKTGSRMIYWFPFWWHGLPEEDCLILDFSDGDAVNGHDVDPEPCTMEKNVKGHFMVNIAHYLFGNLSATEAGNPAAFAAKSLEQAWTPGYEEMIGLS